jgi:hypothetical protein
METQAVLQRIRFRSPQAAIWAGMGHTLATMIFPSPSYKAKGSAAAYRRAQVDAPEEK